MANLTPYYNMLKTFNKHLITIYLSFHLNLFNYFFSKDCML